MFGHIEYRDMPGGALGLEPVCVIDPAGWIVLGIIFLLIAIVWYQHEKLKEKDAIIRDQYDMLDYYYNENLIK